ncbi:MAG: PDZ domain-containing protein [Candidatus Eremiobacteraeota bacterium]|nr:PDZ domain-containing protein [Candidatus Eremiobacteraeota bacterium]
MRGFVLAAVLSVAVAFIPTPYQLTAPGRVEEVGPMVTIEAKTYPSKGEFLLPTVVSERATVLYVLYSLLDPNASLTSQTTDEPQAQTPNSNDQQMGLSQYLATVVAFESLGYDLVGESRGLLVVRPGPDSPNRDLVHPGDLLTSVGGETIKSFENLRSVLNKYKPEEKVQSIFRRDGKELDLQLSIYQVDNKNILGLFLRPDFTTEFPFAVKFDAGRTSGASGGLVFALEIYNRLTPEDITKGRRIAATGTLDARGRVGPIEGVNLKMIGAAQAGAEIILIPKSNMEDVSGAPEKVQVIPVESFNEALDALAKT